MQRTKISKALALTCFILFIGLFLYYRVGGFDRPLAIRHSADMGNGTDTIPQAYQDSLALNYYYDSVSPPRLSTSKSMVMAQMKNKVLLNRLKKDTATIRRIWQQHGNMLTKTDSLLRESIRIHDSFMKKHQ